MKLPLETIKQMYNLPQNASMNDVVKFANDNNIEIDFFNTNNNAQTQQNIDNPSGSIYEDNSSQSAAQQQSASTSKSPAQTSLSNKTNFNIDLLNPTLSSSLGTTPYSNNNSVFGFGNQNQMQDDGFMGFQRTTVQAVSQNIATSGQIRFNNDFDDKFKLKLPKLDFLKDVSSTKLDNFLETSLTKADERIAKFGNRTIDPEMEKVVKITFTPDGKIQKTYEDGSIKIEELSGEESKARSKIGKKQRITSLEYVDGKVVETLANGKTRTRDAFFGERGYQKDGNSLDEELQATLGEEYEKAQTTEEKHALMKKYIKDVFMNLSPEEREAKFNELLKNTDRGSEAGQYLMSVAGEFNRKFRTEMQSQVVQSRESAVAQQEVVQSEINTSLSEPAISSQDQRDRIDDAAALAEDFGTQDYFVEQSAQNIGNINDDNAKYVTQTAIKMNSPLATEKFAEATASVTNTNQALLQAANGDEQLAAKIKEELQASAGDVENAHVSVVGDNQITVCNETTCKMIEMDILSGDVQSALKRVGDLDLNTLSNGQAQGIHDAFVDGIKDGTITAEHAENVSHVLINTEIVVDDVSQQREMVDSRNQTLPAADPKLTNAVLGEQGRNGHKYIKENQLYVDEQARLIDENGVYNRSVADNVQNYEDEEIQGIIGQRVYDSGDEEALNAMARHVYEYSDANRDKFIEQLQNSQYDSVKETLNESKAQYEAEQKAKASEENSNSNVNTDSKDSKTSENSSSSIAESARRINNIVNNNTLNTTQKAKQIRTLNPKEQALAISQVIKTATLPEIKSLALSGFKTEIVSCLLTNYSSENQSILETLEPFMNDGEKERYQNVMQQYQSLNLQPQMQAKRNFFTM